MHIRITDVSSFLQKCRFVGKILTKMFFVLRQVNGPFEQLVEIVVYIYLAQVLLN